MNGQTTGGKRLNFVATLNTAPMEAGAAKAKGIIGGLGNFVKSAGIWAPLGGGAIFGLMANNARKFSKDFQMAMKEIQTISAYARTNIEDLEASIMDLGANTPDEILTVARAYYQIVSAGYDGAKALDILKTSTELSTGALTSAFTAADTLTSIMNAYGDKVGDAASISDLLFEVVKNGKTTMEELGANLGNITGLAAQAELEFKDLMAAYATGTKTVKTAEFTTGMRGLLTALIKPADEALELANKLGVEFDLTALKTKGLVGFLKELLEATDGNVKQLGQLFPNVRGLSGLLAIATDNGEEFTRQLENMEKAAGNTAGAAEKMAEAVENKWLVVGNKWKRNMKELGDEINNASGFLADFLDILLTKPQDIPTELPIISGVKERMKALRIMGESVPDSYAQAALSSDDDIQRRLWKMIKDARKAAEQEKPEFDAIMDIDDVEERARRLEALYEQMQSSFGEIFDNPSQAKMYNKLRSDFTASVIAAMDDAKKAIMQEVPEEDPNQMPATIEQLVENFEKLKQRLTYDPQQDKTIITQITEQINNLPDAQSIKEAETMVDGLKEMMDVTPELDLSLLFKIESQQQVVERLAGELKEMLDEVREQTAEKYNLGLDVQKLFKPISPLETRDAKKQQLEQKKLLDNQKELTKEQKEMVKAQKEEEMILNAKIAAQQKLLELFGGLADVMADTNEIMGAITHAAFKMSPELGEAAQKMADVTHNAMNLFKAISQQNTIGIVGSAIALVGDIAGSFNEQAAQNQENRMTAINQLYDIQNAKINKQIELLDELSGDERLQTEEAIREQLEKQLHVLDLQAKQQGIKTEMESSHLWGLIKKWQTGPTFTIDNVDDLEEVLNNNELIQQGLADGTLKIKNLDELMRLIEEYDQVTEQLASIGEEEGTVLERLGFTADSIAQELANGIAEGYRLGQTEAEYFSETLRRGARDGARKTTLDITDGLGDYAETFGKMMGDALRKHLVKVLNDKLLVNFMEEFNKAMEDGEISRIEEGKLEEAMIGAITEGQEVWEKISPILDKYTNTGTEPDSMAGLMRGATEQTMSFVGGQLMRVGEELRSLNLSAAEQIDLVNFSLDELKAIRANTNHNQKLGKMSTDLAEMKNHILRKL